MEKEVVFFNKARINSIDMLRGFALMGILLIHCFDRFGAGYFPRLDSPFWQWIDTALRNSVYFLFQGKAYAIFSLLFGVSFFMMMDSQAQKGVDFRMRFLWRLAILFVFGFFNGMIYYVEWLLIYAMFGIIIIPLYKVPNKILVALCILLLLEIPLVIDFISSLNASAPATPSGMRRTMGQLYREAGEIFANGSIWEMIKFNAIRGHSVEVLYVLNARVFQLIGLFIAGMLIGRSGVYKNPDKMVYWSKKILPYAICCFLLCYIIVKWILPAFDLERRVLRAGTNIVNTYGNLGMLMMYICGLIILYYKTLRGNKILDRLAPVGRMSVTNYMVQSIMGAFIFYGFGLGLAKQSNIICFLIWIVLFLFQILYSNWWIKRFYFGPMEWLWRTLTWFKKSPMKRINDYNTPT